jgi:aryl-alcohol dehydrogenase-like predicted oxidoreductase
MATPIIASQLDRRDFLAHAAGAALCGGVAAALPDNARASAKRERVVNRRLPAAAAGTLWLGGELEVARMGFGAMRITGDGIWGEPRDQREARALLRRAVELGVNFIDTADAYGPDVSERLIKEALHPYPRGLVVSTKGGMTRQGPNQWAPNGRPEHLRAACEASLRRLKLEAHPVYQLHRPDPAVPYADSIGELAKLQQEGKIRHLGVSNVTVEQLAIARSIVEVVSVQNRYHVAERSSQEVLDVCTRDGIAFIPWGPLAQRAQQSDRPDPAIAALRTVAAERGTPISQAALAWLLAKSPVMLPIPGTSQIKHLEENVAAATLRLSSADMRHIG